MRKKLISASTPDIRPTAPVRDDVPYDPQNEAAVMAFWDEGIAHQGLADLHAKRGRPPKAVGERKEQIALRVDADVVAWYRQQGGGWQTRMNAVLKAYRDATI